MQGMEITAQAEIASSMIQSHQSVRSASFDRFKCILSIGLIALHLFLSNRAQQRIRRPFARDALSTLHSIAALDASIPFVNLLLTEQFHSAASALCALLRGLQPGLRIMLCLDIARRLVPSIADDGLRLLMHVHAPQAFSFAAAVAIALCVVDWFQSFAAYRVRGGGAVFREFASARRMQFVFEESVRLASLCAHLILFSVVLSLWNRLNSPTICALASSGALVADFFVENSWGPLPAVLAEVFLGGTLIDEYQAHI